MGDFMTFVKRRKLTDELDAKDKEDLGNIVEYMVDEFNKGGTEKLRETFDQAFQLDSESVIAVLVLLELIDHLTSVKCQESIEGEE